MLSYFSTYSPTELRRLSYRGANLISLCPRSLPPGIGTTMWHSSPPIWHSENGGADWTGIFWDVRKYVNADSMRFALCSGVSFFGRQLVLSFPNRRCSVIILCNKQRGILWKLTAGHSWRWISIGAMLCTFKHSITDSTSPSAWAGIRASTFNAATMLVWEVGKFR